MVEYVKYEEDEKTSRKPFTFRLNSYVLIIIMINFLFFIGQSAIPGFENFFILNTQNVLQKPWSLITTIFLHANFSHIFFNMYALFLFGIILESKIGPKKFLLSYLTIGLIVSIASVFIYPGFVLGASGAVMGIIGILIMVRPNLQLLFFFILPLKLWVAGIIWFILDLLGTFSPASGVANLAHIIGMILGLAYGYYLVNKNQELKKTHIFK